MNRVAIKQYLKQIKANSGPAVVDPEQLAKGINVEKEHKETIQTLKKNPAMSVSEGAARIAEDHLQEFPGKPYYSELEKLEEKLRGKKSSQYFHNKLILKAISRESEFRKEIPEDIKRIVQKDPGKAQELSQQMGQFWDSVLPTGGQTPSGAQQYQKFIQDQMAQQQQQKEPFKDTIRKGLMGLQGQVNKANLTDNTLLTNAQTMLQSNPQDWNALTDFIGQQLVGELQKHTLYNPKKLLADLSKAGGDLRALFTTDDYLK